MANRVTTATSGYFRTLFAVGTATGLTDAQLLERVVAASAAARAAESAFEAIVARHGPMVLGVCRRALDDPRDVEDAFQATFLVLVRKAGTVHVDDSLGRWLYGVARRVARRARVNAHRRRARESAHEKGEPVMPPPDAERAELLAGLDDELGRLPEKYRAPLVLCYLEGLSHPEAARQLRWPVGTVKGRLAQARNLLRTRLTHRGLAPSVALLAATLEAEARPAVTLGLAEATIRSGLVLAVGGPAAATAASASVAHLMKGTLKAMLMLKLKTATIGLVTALSLTAAAGALAQAQNGDDARAPVERDDTHKQLAADRTEAVPVFNDLATPAEVLFVARDGTAVERGDLICTLDPAALDMQKARQTLLIENARAALQNAKQAPEVAELALVEYDTVYEQELQAAKRAVDLARANQKRAEDRVRWSDAMLKKGYVSESQNIADQVALKQAEFAREQAETKLMVLERFTYTKTIKELQGEIEKARSDEAVMERALDLERKALASIEEQVKRCRIHAPVSGRLVHARWRPPGSDGGFTKIAVGRTARPEQLLFWIFPDKTAEKDEK